MNASDMKTCMPILENARLHVAGGKEENWRVLRYQAAEIGAMELLFEAGTLQLQSAVSFVGWIVHTAALSTLPPTVQQRKFGTGSTASWVNNVIKLMFYPIQKDFMHKDFVSKRDVLETFFFSAMSK